ncbi:hypothetical protein L208DRAFT_1457957 [Tricholoma matsutake]|nr:hypothetical protein L208DRAFT_1457957 [Tricholoma matsutake 945]
MAAPSSQSFELPQEPHSALLSTGELVDEGRVSPISPNAKSSASSDLSLPHPPESESQETVSSGGTLFTDDPFDFEKTLRGILQKRDEAEILGRELGVMFRNLKVVGLGAAAAHFSTVGSVLNPMIALEKIQTLRHPPLRDIISGFEGVVRPGEMLLVLGSPGSGCTTFLKMIANQRSEYNSVHGDVYYDSLTPTEVAKHYRGDVQYCPEDDVHFASLTVEQTINFAAMTRVPQSRIFESRAAYADTLTHMLTTIFGLNHVLKTPVGDAVIRGVSGGEKKRVSISEALATRSRITCWDNSTRGLDASTALEFGRALRIATDLDRLTTVVSIYQAGETLYELFDKVCVIYEGRMAYFGPANRARQYFIDMGYEPANRQTTPDFLVSVTDSNSRIPRDGFINMPRTPAEYSDYFNKSSVGQLNRDDMTRYEEAYVNIPDRAQGYRKSVLAEHAKHTRKKSPYTISIPMQARAVMKRRAQILIGNKPETIIGLLSYIFQGVILGTTFVNTPVATKAYFSRGGLLFFTVLFPSLASMSEIPALFAQRRIVLRHQKAAMYHPFIEALAMTLVGAPIFFVFLVIFSVLVYFSADLQRTAGQFFIFLLFLNITSFTMQTFFRAIAAAFKSDATAQSVAGIVLLATIIYMGFEIPKKSMIGALHWISFLDAPRFGFESIISNEFHSINGTCSTLVPSGAGYEGVSLANQVCAIGGSISGQSLVDGNKYINFTYVYNFSHVWRNFGIVVAYLGGFLVALLILSEFNTATSSDTSMILFKRGSKSTVIENAMVGADEEKSVSPTVSSAKQEVNGTDKESVKPPPMADMFSWQHVSYTVRVSEGDRVLLDDVSGYVTPGKLTALMGESGAGKTTLLNVLAHRTDVGIVTGDRLVNGHSLPPDFQSQTGYCQQMDTHVPTDTVRDALLFSAMMRQPESVPTSEKEAYVEICLKMCGLEAFADAAVGSLGVEQRKRTTIGVELAAKPKLLLFLDEPTSGLDSRSAWAIVAFMRQLADNGQAILCTIHQPSAELFQVFDRLLLLRKGGQTVYFGDIGDKATTVIRYFENNGSRHCEPTENPAEFMLDVIGAGATATSAQNWHAVWKSTPEATTVQKEIDEIHANGRSRPPVDAAFHGEFATSWFNQVQLLLRRGFRADWRSPSYVLAKMALCMLLGLFIGFSFFKANNSQQGTQNKLLAVYMATVVAAPLTQQLQVPFLKTRSIYEIRERPSRMYSWTALLTSQFLVETPWNLFGATGFFFCWYWTIGFPSSRAAYTFLVFCVIFPMYFTSFAQAVAAMVPTADLAGLIFSVLFCYVLLFNGVLQPFPQLGWWKWMFYITPYTYFTESLLGQAIAHQPVVCSTEEYVTLYPPSGQTCGSFLQNYINRTGGYVLDPSSTSSCQFCTFATTDQLMGKNWNFFYHHRWRNVGVMIAFTILNIGSIYILTYLFRIRTGSLLPSFRRRKSS